MPNVLEGLKVDDFAHADDLAAIRAMKNVEPIDKFMSWVEDKSNQMYLRMNTLGNCIRITPNGCPELYETVANVCEILDYSMMPEIYTMRSYAMDVTPEGVNQPILIIPDFVANITDKGILYFIIGRAVTRLKSGYMKFYSAANLLINVSEILPAGAEAVKLPLVSWMKKSELTADRGGLLACQNFSAASRYMLCKAGMPLHMTKDVSVSEYINACRYSDKTATVGKAVKSLSEKDGFINDRIVQLFTWYNGSNYGDILDKYLD